MIVTSGAAKPGPGGKTDLEIACCLVTKCKI